MRFQSLFLETAAANCNVAAFDNAMCLAVSRLRAAPLSSRPRPHCSSSRCCKHSALLSPSKRQSAPATLLFCASQTRYALPDDEQRLGHRYRRSPPDRPVGEARDGSLLSRSLVFTAPLGLHTDRSRAAPLIPALLSSAARLSRQRRRPAQSGLPAGGLARTAARRSLTARADALHALSAHPSRRPFPLPVGSVRGAHPRTARGQCSHHSDAPSAPAASV